MWIFSLKLVKRKKVISRVVDLYPLKKKSVVKDDDFEGKRIRSGRSSERSNHYKSIYIYFLNYNFCL